MNNFYRQFISHITVVYVVVLSHDITGGATEKTGRPGLRIRLLVGLHYLKHAYNVSDEKVVEGYLENPYWQHFKWLGF
ncbi:transposase PF05598 domain protein [Leptospira noguchii str. 2007001578]|uniref:Transposase PF05598 domain protein n=1 Tax=Leptospira noguchii str. 2007001578 TaxID=1049974 RepID=A0ABP2TBG8_9LEPT|nr:transposase PF05598 domain protein [Leptospira noguchii str. 2007001578]